MEDVRRLNLVVPGVLDQALRVAEHTVLPIEHACRVVAFGAARHGLLPDAVYEDAIGLSSVRWSTAASGRIADGAINLLRVMLP